MGLTEFKRHLSCLTSTKATDLLRDWDGCDDITIDKANEYKCTLGDIIRTLDKMGIIHSLECSYTGMYIRITSVCR